MDEAVKTEIRKIALGYDLKYKISNMRMETYLAPEYLQLRRKTSTLNCVSWSSSRSWSRFVLMLERELRQCKGGKQDRPKVFPMHSPWDWLGRTPCAAGSALLRGDWSKRT